LKTVADDAGVSEAMVVKIAKKLGLAGFKDFRASIVGYNGLPTSELHQELSPDDTGVEIAQKVFRSSIHALEETLSILDPEAFEKAADTDPPKFGLVSCAGGMVVAGWPLGGSPPCPLSPSART